MLSPGDNQAQSCVSAQAEFFRRLQHIRTHGLGLSVDVYTPDVSTLLQRLRQRQVAPSYLEIFRATRTALAAVRQEAGDGLLAYHGEGLWLTQPEAGTDPLLMREVCEVAEHLQILQSEWLNHECATKHLAGYSFGTYLPPLYTELSAEVVAEHTVLVQDWLDRYGQLGNGGAPLVLLEMPPLTYFVAGTISIPTFFRLVTDRAACGLVLDVGHLWTVYRYTGAWKTTTLMQFVDQFMSEFPMERVVEIHVAGLTVHESSEAAETTMSDDSPPAWTDAHAVPIPPVLFDMLDRILTHPRLISLKGLALEVDTKPVDLIVDELERFVGRYTTVSFCPITDTPITPLHMKRALQRESVSEPKKAALAGEYDRYAQVLAGRLQPEGVEWTSPIACHEDLEQYQSVYLPHEILH